MKQMWKNPLKMKHLSGELSAEDTVVDSVFLCVGVCVCEKTPLVYKDKRKHRRSPPAEDEKLRFALGIVAV